MKNLSKGFLKSYNFLFLIKTKKSLDKIFSKNYIVKKASTSWTMPAFKKNFTKRNMRKVSSCFLLLHLCDVIQFRDDHVRMRIRGPLAPPACLKFWQHGKLFWALMSYLKAIFGNIRTHIWRWISEEGKLTL